MLLQGGGAKSSLLRTRAVSAYQLGRHVFCLRLCCFCAPAAMGMHAAQRAARHSSLDELPCRLNIMASACREVPMSSIAEELDVTSEANLLFIGLLLAKGPPHPDAPEHANVRTAFAALHTWVCCPAASHRLCFKAAVALPSLDSGQPNGDPAACSGFTIAASMRRCCLTPSVRQPTSSAVGSFKVERRLH